VKRSGQKGCPDLLAEGSKTGASESGFESREMALEAKVFCGFGEVFHTPENPSENGSSDDLSAKATGVWKSRLGETQNRRTPRAKRNPARGGVPVAAGGYLK
jgi:hypothetical protein